MNVVKNSFGVSYSLNPKIVSYDLLGTFAGSSLNRKPSAKKSKKETKEEKDDSVKRENKLSSRSKMKIRNKIHALTGVLSHLVFVTLTFQNKVEDRLGVRALKCFLNNVRKRRPDAEYIWIAEKQSRNKKFKDNLHFHLITNVYWDIKKWWKYWVEVQEKFGICRTEGISMASSAFDVRKVAITDSKKIGGYIAGYLSKSQDTFDCTVWNCSKRISRLYTAFYSGRSFLDQLKRLEDANELGGKLITIQKEFCNIIFIPLNKTTKRFYERIHVQNRKAWHGKEKEVCHA
jgi:hypothetical protein